MNDNHQPLDELTQAIIDTPKYHFISQELIRRIGRQEILKRKNVKEAIKSSKSKLHQIGGAYSEGKYPYHQWLQELRLIDYDIRKEEFIRKSSLLMSCHASSRERLPFLEEFYVKIFSALPPIQTILDISCGFNPLAIPWMHLGKGTLYWAWDIFSDMVDFLNGYFPLIHQIGKAEVRDVLSLTTTPKVDLALILKTIPCLEQQDKSAGAYLLSIVQARHLVVSFPTKSLGRHEKGMVAHYETGFHRLVAPYQWNIKKILFPSELIFIVDKGK